MAEVIMGGRRLLLLLSVVIWLAPSSSVAQPTGLAVPGACEEGVLPSGARSLICVPALGWNGDLVVYAHGYVPPTVPDLVFAHLDLNGVYLPDLIQSLGFAFATTSYRKNGLAFLEGTEDMVELVGAFRIAKGVPRRTFATGVSEGGLVTAFLAERVPELFTAAYATCGPIGNFRLQINYIGDFRVLFDYYFPGVFKLPGLGTPIDIPQAVIDSWETVYVPLVTAMLLANPARAVELLRVARAPFVPGDFSTVINTTIGLLSYNVLGTNDAKASLGGNPFGNLFRWYSGSSNDLALNRGVQRFAADPAALAAMRAYETDGRLTIPLVTLHTTGDEVVPYAHELLYALKARPSGRGRFVPLPVVRYGHCNFTPGEVLAGFFVTLALP
jgi:pimeloyl-ACP methyl ester carboxylesterase